MSLSCPRPPSATWKDTWFWETLLERKEAGSQASSFMRTLEGWMNKLDTVLRSGGTSPQDFTLHDEKHSLRVADRMEQLLTDEIRGNLTDYEIALLFLARQLPTEMLVCDIIIRRQLHLAPPLPRDIRANFPVTSNPTSIQCSKY